MAGQQQEFRAYNDLGSSCSKPSVGDDVAGRYIMLKDGRNGGQTQPSDIMAWPNVYNLDSSKFDKDAARQPSRATIVLVHDAFHTPAHLEQVVRQLREAGYRVVTPQLPSSSSTYLPNIFEADVQVVHDHSKPEIEAGRNVMFVLHGYAGLPGSVAAERLVRYALNRPRAGFVVKLAFVAGLVAKAGECYLDMVKPEWLIHEVRRLGFSPSFFLCLS